MPHTGADLGLDLYELWHAGRNLLPPVAELIEDAKRDLSASGDGDFRAFARGSVYGGPFGPAQRHITELRDELVMILRDTTTNIDMIADALVMAADAYAEVDQGAKAEFERLRSIRAAVPQ